MEIDSKDHK